MAKKKKISSRIMKSYSTSDIEKSLLQVKKGMSLRAASKAFNVPYATLHSRVNGIYPLDAKPGPQAIFNKEEEKELVKWIFFANKNGFPVTKQHLLDSVQQLVKKTKRVTPFKNHRPSKHWYSAFLKRNPEISEKMCQNLTKRRASVNEDDLRKWYRNIKSYLESKNLLKIGPERIFNLDESAFYLSPKCSKVLVSKGEKAVYNVCNSDKECYTALIVGNAAGKLAPSMIVYKHERIPAMIAQHFPNSFVIGKSETGWMTGETFFAYIANNFYNWCVATGIQFPIILYVDGHSSHLTMALSDFCVDNGIELIALFPNATHIMQPMDVALFHPLKEAYREAIRAWRLENNGQLLNKVFFPTVLKNALDSLDVKKILSNGFRKCGLQPFSENAIDYSKLIKSSEEIEKESVSEETYSAVNINNISFIESHIDPEILKQFKNSLKNKEEWNGSLENRELFYFWQRCQETISNEFILHQANQVCSDEPQSIISVEECTMDLDTSTADKVIKEFIINEDGTVSPIDEKTLPNIIDISSNDSLIINDNTNSACKEQNSNIIKNNEMEEKFNCSYIKTDNVSDVEEHECEPLKLTIINKSNNKDKVSIDVNYNLDTKQTFSQYFALDVENNPINGVADVSDKFGASQVSMDCLSASKKPILNDENILKNTDKSEYKVTPFKQHLFWPKNNLTIEKKRSRERLPSVATSDEWRIWHQQKNDEKEKKEKLKRENKIVKENNIKIKQELEENLKKMKQEKIKVLAQLNEIDLILQENKAKKKLSQIKLKSKIITNKEELMQEVKVIEEIIQENSKKKEELLTVKKNLIEHEKCTKGKNNAIKSKFQYNYKENEVEHK